MKVKVRQRYLDIDRAEIMEPDQEFEVKDEKRVQKLVSLGYVEVIEDPAPAAEPPAEAPKPAPKKTTRKKKSE